MQIYSMYDSKACAFIQPFFSRTEGVAVRQLSQAINDGKHDFCIHAEDYTLFHLGSWDEVSGLVESNKTPVSVTTCLALKSLTNGAAKPGDLGAVPFGVA